MSSLNKTSLIGHLGRAVELRYFPDGTPIASVTLATTDVWKDKASGERRESTEWHRLVFRRGLAETADKYLTTGSQIYVEGKLKTREFEDSHGARRFVTEVHVAELVMLGGKRKDGQGQPGEVPEPDPQVRELEDVDIPF